MPTVPNSDLILHGPIVEKQFEETDILLDADSPIRKDFEPPSMDLNMSDPDLNLVEPQSSEIHTRRITRQEQNRNHQRKKKEKQLEKLNTEFSIDALDSYEIEKIVGHR